MLRQMMMMMMMMMMMCMYVMQHWYLFESGTNNQLTYLNLCLVSVSVGSECREHIIVTCVALKLLMLVSVAGNSRLLNVRCLFRELLH